LRGRLADMVRSFRTALFSALAFLVLSQGCGNSPTDSPGNPTPSTLSISLLADSAVYSSWTQCPDSDFSAYVLWRSQSPGIQADPSAAQAVRIVSDDPLINSWTDTTVAQGETYWYVLETRNTGLLSAWSNEESLTVPLNEPTNLTVFFIDPSYGSRSGDAILVRTPNGFNYLIDGGDRSYSWSCGRHRIVPMLDSLGITKLDGVVATHPHADHVGGLIGVIEDFPVERVWDCGWTGDASATYEEFLQAVWESDAEFIEGYRGMTLDWDPDLHVEVLNPEPSPGSGVTMNNSSIVIRLSYEDVSFLFTGDLDTEDGEEILLSLYDPQDLQATVLKVGHHGSKNASSNAWLEAVSPSYGAITVGSGNPYGHPHQETLDRLAQHGVTVYSTGQTGTFVITTDGFDITVF
jgi:competence protein ComEC